MHNGFVAAGCAAVLLGTAVLGCIDVYEKNGVNFMMYFSGLNMEVVLRNMLITRSVKVAFVFVFLLSIGFESGAWAQKNSRAAEQLPLQVVNVLMRGYIEVKMSSEGNDYIFNVQLSNGIRRDKLAYRCFDAACLFKESLKKSKTGYVFENRDPELFLQLDSLRVLEYRFRDVAERGMRIASLAPVQLHCISSGLKGENYDSDLIVVPEDVSVLSSLYRLQRYDGVSFGDRRITNGSKHELMNLNKYVELGGVVLLNRVDAQRVFEINNLIGESLVSKILVSKNARDVELRDGGVLDYKGFRVGAGVVLVYESEVLYDVEAAASFATWNHELNLINVDLLNFAEEVASFASLSLPPLLLLMLGFMVWLSLSGVVIWRLKKYPWIQVIKYFSVLSIGLTVALFVIRFTWPPERAHVVVHALAESGIERSAAWAKSTRLSVFRGFAEVSGRSLFELSGDKSIVNVSVEEERFKLSGMPLKRVITGDRLAGTGEKWFDEKGFTVVDGYTLKAAVYVALHDGFKCLGFNLCSQKKSSRDAAEVLHLQLSNAEKRLYVRILRKVAQWNRAVDVGILTDNKGVLHIVLRSAR